MTGPVRRALVLILGVLALSMGCSSGSDDERPDAEVELNTALGRRASPSSTDGRPQATMTSAAPATTVGPGTVATISETTSTTTLGTTSPPTTLEPCSSLGTVSVSVSETEWWLAGRASDGTAIRSVPLPLADGLGRLVAERDLDGDGGPELLVLVEGDDLASRLHVFEFRDCALSEPRNPLTGHLRIWILHGGDNV